MNTDSPSPQMEGLCPNGQGIRTAQAQNLRSQSERAGYSDSSSPKWKVSVRKSRVFGQFKPQMEGLCPKEQSIRTVQAQNGRSQSERAGYSDSISPKWKIPVRMPHRFKKLRLNPTPPVQTIHPSKHPKTIAANLNLKTPQALTYIISAKLNKKHTIPSKLKMYRVFFYKK
ncbi:hypothetical protein [Neobacillus cucumis]|uniref:hypothetical protein n=1 Tax=Neobacillus cucumis TaxID=1740721 RepID=UPI003671E21E